MNYKRIELDLTQSREDEGIELGNGFRNFLILKADQPIRFRLNSKTADVLYSEELQGFQGDGLFRRVYVSNDAGNGKAVLVVF